MCSNITNSRALGCPGVALGGTGAQLLPVCTGHHLLQGDEQSPACILGTHTPAMALSPTQRCTWRHPLVVSAPSLLSSWWGAQPCSSATTCVVPEQSRNHS